MKKLITKLLVVIFSLVLCVNLSAEEWKSYKFKGTRNDNWSTQSSEDIITLAEGDKVEFVTLIGSHPSESQLRAEVSLDDEFKATLEFRPESKLIRQNIQTIYGPCKVQPFGYNYRDNWVACVCKITRASESPGKGYSLVLPESTDTNYNLVLESSTDLVSWTADTTGTKTPSDKKRFYRLRAVKE